MMNYYLNLKNGLNDIYYYVSNDSYNNLPSLEAICVDDVNSIFVSEMQNIVNATVVFTEYCSFTQGGEF